MELMSLIIGIGLGVGSTLGLILWLALCYSKEKINERVKEIKPEKRGL